VDQTSIRMTEVSDSVQRDDTFGQGILKRPQKSKNQDTGLITELREAAGGWTTPSMGTGVRQ
jgi:hypothetical protein